jgi:hypothetical protein
LGAALVGAGFVAAFAWLPARDESTVASMLSRGAAGSVDAGEYVWGPSGGAAADLVRGRPVVFLARDQDGATRDAWAARVSVTPGGRPLFVRALRRLTDTPFGDEADLVASSRGFAFRTVFAGRAESVILSSWTDAAGPVRVGFRAPAPSLEYRWSGDELVFDVAGAAASVTLGRVTTAEPGAGVMVGDSQSPAAAQDAPLVIQASSPEALTPYPSPPFGAAVASVLEGGPPIVAEAHTAGARTLELDGRQVELYVVPGASAPRSLTGRMAAAAPWTDFDASRVVAVVALPHGPATTGWLDGGTPFGPIPAGEPALAIGAGAASLGAWPFEPWDVHGFDAAVKLAGQPGDSLFAACVTKGGHVAIGWGTKESPPLPGDCVVSVAGAASGGDVWAGPDAIEQWRAKGENQSSVLVALRRDPKADVSGLPLGLEWAPDADMQSDPTWLPAAWKGQSKRLGADVTVDVVDASRFRFALVAGEGERAHRFGGQFPTKVSEADAPLARFAVGLANGKRRGPRGLRIGGSTGLAFKTQTALLEVRDGALAIVAPSERGGAEPTADGTELPLAADGGALLSAARERGPRQLRADICLLDERRLAVAESVFDSHEANATLLLELGCARVVALDRGTEHPAWRASGEAARGPFETTALVALEVPRAGRATPLGATSTNTQR